jgi:hypothetical protein
MTKKKSAILLTRILPKEMQDHARILIKIEYCRSPELKLKKFTSIVTMSYFYALATNSAFSFWIEIYHKYKLKD